MIWQKDRLRPTQPYFVFDTEDFFQEVYLRQGISHFYTFRAAENAPLRTVPDGCIDFSFEFGDGCMESYVCGTKLQYTCENWSGMREVFGVRFMPGMQPEMLRATMREVLGHKLPLREALAGDTAWLDLLEQETDFYQRIRIFLEHFTRAERRREPLFGPRVLVQSVKQMVYASDGKIQVSEMQRATGYSERYIHMTFVEEMGFSPKTFCKIIQFQRALECLNYGAPESMTDTAVALGYYDQAQFIRDFTKYAGITPKKYLGMVQELHYRSRVQETNFLRRYPEQS